MPSARKEAAHLKKSFMARKEFALINWVENNLTAQRNKTTFSLGKKKGKNKRKPLCSTNNFCDSKVIYSTVAGILRNQTFRLSSKHYRNNLRIA